MEIGDQVIYQQSFNKRPTIDIVIKVTPKGWVRIKTKPDVVFVPKKYSSNGECEERTGYGNGRLFPFSEAKLAELNKAVDEQEARTNERVAAEKARRAEIANREKEQLNAVKALMGDLKTHIKFHEVLPDESRLYILDVPTKTDLNQRKRGYERAIVRCITLKKEDGKWIDDDEVGKIKLWITYANGGNDSFPSMSGNTADTDEEALWEAARYLHNSW